MTEDKERWSYYRRSDEELRDLAKRLYDGRVFMLTDPTKIQMAFPIIMFMSPEDREELIKGPEELFFGVAVKELFGFSIEDGA